MAVPGQLKVHRAASRLVGEVWLVGEQHCAGVRRDPAQGLLEVCGLLPHVIHARQRQRGAPAPNPHPLVAQNGHANPLQLALYPVGASPVVVVPQHGEDPMRRLQTAQDVGALGRVLRRGADEIPGQADEVWPKRVGRADCASQVLVAHQRAAVEVGELRPLQPVQRGGQPGQPDAVPLNHEAFGFPPPGACRHERGAAVQSRARCRPEESPPAPAILGVCGNPPGRCLA